MADNVAITAGAGTTIATDDVGGGVQVQRVKATWGVDGTAADVTAIAGLPTQGTQPAVSTANWTSATTVNTAVTVPITGLSTVTIGMHNTSTMTAGVLTFEVSPDNTNWFPIIVNRIDSYVAELAYTLSAVADRGWSASVDAWNFFRVRLSTVITGSGTASIFVAASSEAIEPNVTVGQATAANLQVTTQPAGSTGAQTSVAATVTTNTTLIAADATRKGLTIYNESTSVLFVLLGAGTESSSVYTVQIPANGYYEVPQGFAALRASGHWVTANGNARITAVV